MKIKFKLPDGSTYELKRKKWKKALVFKLQAEGLDIKEDFEEIQAFFNSKVKKHWYNKTVPTKFEWDIPWKEYFQEQMKSHEDDDIKKPITTFNKMSDLADVVMHQIIRAALMGLILSELTKNRKKKSHVIALSGNKAIIYSDKKPMRKKVAEIFKLNNI